MSTATEQQPSELRDKLARALSERDALAQENQRLREVLKVAAETFRWYEKLHRAKGTSDGLEKTNQNMLLAIRCEAALEGKEGEAWQSDSVSQAKYQKLFGALEDLASCQPEADTEEWRRLRDAAYIVLYGKSDAVAKP